MPCNVVEVCALLAYSFDPEDAGSVFLCNVSKLLPDYVTSQKITLFTANIPLYKMSRIY
jgi:hypothetical protein